MKYYSIHHIMYLVRNYVLYWIRYTLLHITLYTILRAIKNIKLYAILFTITIVYHTIYTINSTISILLQKYFEYIMSTIRHRLACSCRRLRRISEAELFGPVAAAAAKSIEAAPSMDGLDEMVAVRTSVEAAATEGLPPITRRASRVASTASRAANTITCRSRRPAICMRN